MRSEYFLWPGATDGSSGESRRGFVWIPNSPVTSFCVLGSGDGRGLTAKQFPAREKKPSSHVSLPCSFLVKKLGSRHCSGPGQNDANSSNWSIIHSLVVLNLCFAKISSKKNYQNSIVIQSRAFSSLIIIFIYLLCLQMKDIPMVFDSTELIFSDAYTILHYMYTSWS